jgi:poly(3-hydroxybutyrate) depolymerase
MLLIGDSGATAEETAATTGLESAAATEGFVLATLDGSSGSWNAGHVRGADDLGYAKAAIDRAGIKGCADTSQLSIVGFGTGAAMAASLACDPDIHPHQLVMIRGVYLPPTCVPTQPTSVLMDVDQGDTVLPVAGGWGTTAPAVGYTPSSLADAYDGWSRIEKCGTTSTGEAESSGVVVSQRAGCASGDQVVARVTNGQGHSWPSEAIGATVRFVSSR